MIRIQETDVSEEVGTLEILIQQVEKQVSIKLMRRRGNVLCGQYHNKSLIKIIAWSYTGCECHTSNPASPAQVEKYAQLLRKNKETITKMVSALPSLEQELPTELYQ